MARLETLAAIARDGARHALDGIEETRVAIDRLASPMSYSQDVITDAAIESAATLYEAAARRIRMVQAERDRMRQDAAEKCGRVSGEIQDAMRVGEQVIRLHAQKENA